MNLKKTEIKDLEKIAKNLIEKISNKKTKKAIVLAMHGDLGSGKTTLTQKIGEQLGIKNKIISPTFVIMKKYQLKNKRFKKLIHIDAYRLNKKEEMIHLGWNEIISDNENIIIIEWPEKIEGLVPKDSIVVKLTHIDNDTRGIVF